MFADVVRFSLRRPSSRKPPQDLLYHPTSASAASPFSAAPAAGNGEPHRGAAAASDGVSDAVATVADDEMSAANLDHPDACASGGAGSGDVGGPSGGWAGARLMSEMPGRAGARKSGVVSGRTREIEGSSGGGGGRDNVEEWQEVTVPSEDSLKGREWRVLVESCQAVDDNFLGNGKSKKQDGQRRPAGGVMGLELELREVSVHLV